jgi:hypothetical protein
VVIVSPLEERMKHWRILAVITVAVAAAVVPALSLSASTAWTTSLVASGLDSPRGLAFAPNGDLYVAEGGHGGDACKPRAGSLLCIGTSGRISRVDTSAGRVTPVVTGLYSRAVPNEGITGVDGVAAAGGRLLATITSYPQEVASFDCAGLPTDCGASLTAARAQAGQLISFTRNGTWRAVSSIGGSDYTWSTTDSSLTRSPPNANPYGLFGVAGGTYVADAGANVLDFVSASGATSIISGIPLPAAGGFPRDGVPTCVTVTRGNLYAADLAGRVWKRNGNYAPTQIPVTDAAGAALIHHVTGCASDANGNIYLVDMWGRPGPPIPAGPASVANTGSVVELQKDGSAVVLATGLNFPNGIALAKDGSIYVTTNSICTTTGTPLPFCGQGGQLVRVQQS